MQTDEELLPNLARRDEQAFLAIYHRHEGPLFRYASHMLGSPEAAAEVVQETFLALLNRARELDTSRGPVRAWLYAVARNQILKLLVGNSRFSPFTEEEEVFGSDPGIHAQLEEEQLLERLREAVPLLPAVYREAVVLCDMQEIAQDEAARIIGCPPATLRTRLHRARRLLSAKLKTAVRCPE